MRSSMGPSYSLRVASLAPVSILSALMICVPAAPVGAGGMPRVADDGATAVVGTASALTPRLRGPARMAHAAALGPACPSHYDARWWDGFALPIRNGGVHAFTADGPDLIAGGNFVQTGLIQTVYVGRWNGNTWSALGEGPDSPVNAFTWWNGHLIAGCDYDITRSLLQPVVFEFDGTSWQPLGAMDSGVNALATYGGDLIAIGDFTHADGASTGAVARWNGSQWQPLGSGFPEGNGLALAVYGSDLIAGGGFTNSGGIARWNGTSWSTLGGDLQGGRYVRALLADGTNLYASGEFTDPTGASFAGLPCWNGAAWTSLGVNSGVISSKSLALYGGAVVASAGSSPVGGRSVSWNGATWNTLSDGLSAEAEALFPWGTQLVAATPGNLSGAPVTDGIVLYDGSTWSALVEDWVPGIMAGLGGVATGAASYAGQLVVGGSIFTAGAQDHLIPTSTVASWNGTQWASVGATGLGGGAITSMTEWNDSLVVGMYSGKIGGVTARFIARWDGTAWGPIGAGFNNWVYAVATYDGEPVAFGIMSKSGTTTVNGAARWDGSTWQPLGSGFDVFTPRVPYAALQWGSDLIAAGDFAAAGGVAASNIARWDGSAWHALGAGLDGYTTALAVYGGDLIAGGEFTHAGGAPAAGAARWNGSAWSPMGDNAVEVNVLRVVDGRLYGAGEFLCADGSEAYGLAIWNGQSWVLTGSGFGPAYFYFIQPWNGDLYVGGGFGWANGHPSFNIARLMDYASVGVGPNAPIVALRLRAPRPNPSRASVEFQYELPAASRVRLAIFDVSGRRIATLVEGALPAGANSATWSGRDERGRERGAGLYFARLETTLGARSVKLVRSP